MLFDPFCRLRASGGPPFFPLPLQHAREDHFFFLSRIRSLFFLPFLYLSVSPLLSFSFRRLWPFLFVSSPFFPSIYALTIVPSRPPGPSNFLPSSGFRPQFIRMIRDLIDEKHSGVLFPGRAQGATPFPLFSSSSFPPQYDLHVALEKRQNFFLSFSFSPPLTHRRFHSGTCSFFPRRR